MKTSTLACYLESIANALRLSKQATVPHIKWTAFKGPKVLLVGSTSIPMPDHVGEKDLASVFPDAIPAEAVDGSQAAKVYNRNAEAAAQDLAHQVDVLTADRNKVAEALRRANLLVQSLGLEVEGLRAERDALQQTVARQRQATVAGVPVIAPAPRVQVPQAPAGDLVSQIVADAQAGVSKEAVPGIMSPALVVVAFRLNRQGKTLADAGVSLDDLRGRFSFRFIDPKDATRGGYWLAKDPTAPGTHLMVQRLAEAGAIIGDHLPVTAAL